MADLSYTFSRLYALGIIDPDVHRWPVWDKILATCHQIIARPAIMFMNKNHEHGGLLIMINDDLCQIKLVLKTKQFLSQTQKYSVYIESV
jgi:hypothetical protein